MADFVQTMKDWRRMCKAYTTDDDSCCEGCPVVDFHEHGCGAIFEMEDSTDWQKYADTIMSWAAKHPEPVYPTWAEWLESKHVITVTQIDDYTKNVLPAFYMFSPIQADIAEKLEIEPKEGI